MNEEFKAAIEFCSKQSLNTPVTFYSEHRASEAAELMCQSLGDNTEIYVAIKSCYNLPLLKSFAKMSFGAEIMTELEYDIALKAGYKKIIVNGLGRSRSFLERVVNSEIESIVIVETDSDIQNLAQISNGVKKPIKAGIRIKINSTDSSNNYSDVNNKLGVEPDSSVFRNFIQAVKIKQFSWALIHSHFTINETQSSPYDAAAQELKKVLSITKLNPNFLPKTISLGGGFEVYDIEKRDTFSKLFGDINNIFSKHFTKEQTLVLEPGRYLTCNAGFTLGKVKDIKVTNGKSWVVTDIGTNTLIPIDNARYKLGYPSPNKENADTFGITDGITSPQNNIIMSVKMEKPKTDDWIVIENTGAYTDVYSTFWAYEPHIVCFISSNGSMSVTRSRSDIKNLRKILIGA
jgi:diaminopimelate decarboxylase